MIRPPATPYPPFIEDISRLLDEARQQAARTVNAFLTATYWEIGRRIVEYEQKGKKGAEYGSSALLQRLSKDLTVRFGRGFGEINRPGPNCRSACGIAKDACWFEPSATR